MVEDCDRPSHARDLCQTHYRRLLAHGTPRAEEPIRVVTGKGYDNHGYWVVPVPVADRHLSNGEPAMAEHRLVMARHIDRSLEPDETVHHINGVRDDNRLENLELWSSAHPSGQRVSQKIDFAIDMLRRYAAHLLGEDPSRTETAKPRQNGEVSEPGKRTPDGI